MLRLNPAYLAVEELHKNKKLITIPAFLKAKNQALYCIFTLQAQDITLSLAGKKYQSEKISHLSIYQYYKQSETKGLSVYHFTWYGISVDENGQKTSVTLHAYFDRNGRYRYSQLKNNENKQAMQGISAIEEKIIQQFAQSSSISLMDNINTYILRNYIAAEKDIHQYLGQLETISKRIKSQLPKYKQVAEKCIAAMHTANRWNFGDSDPRENLLIDIIKHVEMDILNDKNTISSLGLYSREKEKQPSQPDTNPKINKRQPVQAINQELEKELKLLDDEISVSTNNSIITEVEKSLITLSLLEKKNSLLMKNTLSSHMQIQMIDVLSKIHNLQDMMATLFEKAAFENDIVSMKKLRPHVRLIDFIFFYKLIEKGNVEVCQYIVENYNECVYYMNNTACTTYDAVVDKKTDLENALTAVQLTLRQDSPLLLEMLLKHGANPDYYGPTSENYKSILIMSIVLGKEDFVRVILENGGNPNPETGKVAAHIADITGLIQDDMTKINKHITNTLKKSPIYKNNNDENPLRVAISTRNINIISLLLENGASVTKMDEMNYDAMGWETCCEYRPPNIEIVKLLIKYGANINAVYNNSLTPLYFSCQKNRLQAVKELTQLGADPNIAVLCKGKRMDNGNTVIIEEYLTPFQKAYYKNHNEIVEYLFNQNYQPLSFTTFAMVCAFHVKTIAYTDLIIDDKTMEFTFRDKSNSIIQLFYIANMFYMEHNRGKEIEDCYEEGKKYFKQKKYEQALNYFYTTFLFTIKNEYQLSAINYIACCYQRTNESELARKFFSVCVNHSPQTTIGQYALKQLEILQPASVYRAYK